MTPSEIRAKLERNESLTPMETALLDAFLQDEEGSGTVSALAAIGHDEPSLAWRSRLNERISAESAVPVRPKFGMALRLSAVAGVATVFALGSFLLRGAPTTAGELTESHAAQATLLQLHEEAHAFTVLPGDGMGFGSLASYKESFVPSEIDKVLYPGDALNRL